VFVRQLAPASPRGTAKERRGAYGRGMKTTARAPTPARN